MRAYNSTSPRWGDLGIKKNVESFHNHLIDFACEIVGVPDSVIATGMDFGKKSIVTTIFNTGKTYSLLESNSSLPDSCPFAIGFELVYENGIVQYNAIYGEYTDEKFILFENGKPTQVVKLEIKDDYEESFKHVLQCIHNNIKSPMLDINSAINQVKVKDMILMSINKKQ